MSLWTDEMASRAGFGPRAVVWRPLVLTVSLSSQILSPLILLQVYVAMTTFTKAAAQRKGF